MESSSSQLVILLEDVLETLMNDGTLDAIQLKIITQLKTNVSSHTNSYIYGFLYMLLNCGSLVTAIFLKKK